MIKPNKIKSTKKCSNLTSNIQSLISKDHRGITLVALIITIIVMLILVGVSLSLALNGGLFDSTKRAAKGTEDAKQKEQELSSGRIKIDGIWYDSLEDYVIGKESAIQGMVDLDERNTKFIYKPEGWTNGEVKVEIDASAVSSGFILKYSTDNINWNNYSTEITMNANGDIYAKLVDSNGKEGGTITGNVKNIDKQAPTVNTHLNSAGASGTAIPLSIDVTDSVSGISKIKWNYKLSTDTDYTTVTSTYVTMNGKDDGEKTAVTKEVTITGLLELSEYNIYAEVYDVAGNHTRSPETGTLDITTSIIPKIGDKIEYEPNEIGEATRTYQLEGKYSGYGTYNNYSLPATFTSPADQTITQESLEWEVLKVHDDGSIDIIGTTTGVVGLGGSLGYNNGVYLLHDICKELYSKPSKGIWARSVSLEDFEDENNGGNWKSFRDDDSNYGTTKTYTEDTETYYPNLYAKENGSGIGTTAVKTDGIKNTDKGYTVPTEETYSKADSNMLTIRYNCYFLPIHNLYIGTSANVLRTSNEYWIAGRYVFFDTASGYFGCLKGGTTILYVLSFTNNGVSWSNSLKIRPVVTLGPDVLLKLSVRGTSGEPNTFEITKY